MGTPVYMDIGEAYSIVQWHGEECGHRNLFGALNSMEENWDDLDSMERAAYKQVNVSLTITIHVRSQLEMCVNRLLKFGLDTRQFVENRLEVPAGTGQQHAGGQGSNRDIRMFV